MVSVYNDNPKKYGLPTTIGTIILYDPETGMPKAIMDGTLITDLRTGAVGISVEDIICAESVFQKALADGAGKVLPFQDL